MTRFFRLVAALLLAAVSTFGAANAAAQTYPSKPVRLVVPMPPGGGTDFWARLTANKMSQILGAQVLVDNRPGAGTRIAAEQVMHADADGYTLMVGDIGTFAVNPGLYAKLPYDPIKDFSPITLTSRQALVLVVPVTAGVDSVKALVAKAKADPNGVNYGSAGVGSPHHLAMELFQDMAGVKMNHVAYKGGAPMALDLVGGQLTAAFMDLPSAMPHLKSGRLKGLAVFSAKRLDTFPDIPTMAELGYAGRTVEAWQGMVAPAGTPPDVVRRLNAAYAEVSKDPEVIRKLREMGMEATPSTPQVFSAYIKSEKDKWGVLIHEKNISAD